MRIELIQPFVITNTLEINASIQKFMCSIKMKAQQQVKEILEVVVSYSFPCSMKHAKYYQNHHVRTISCQPFEDLLSQMRMHALQ